MSKIPAYVWMMVVLVVGIIGILLLVKSSNDRVTANLKLPIEITEYFDYQCSHCAEFFPVLHDIQNQYGSKIKVSFKDFPLPINDNSYVLAYAAKAAEKQGKFQEYHDLIYTTFDDVLAGTKDASTLDPVAFATQLGLDIEKFNADRNSDEVKAAVNADKAEGTKAGVSGTPTVFVSGQLVSLGKLDPATGKVSYDDFRNTIARLVQTAEANSMQEAGSK
jgi:protein-disulfide isomerase